MGKAVVRSGNDNIVILVEWKTCFEISSQTYHVWNNLQKMRSAFQEDISTGTVLD